MGTDADAAGRLVAAWERIEAWLGEHAPASAALLRPPASEADIAAAEAAMGVALPGPLAAWYRVHDGVEEDRVPFGAVEIAGILPSGMTMLPLDRLVREHRTHVRDWDRQVGLVPFARTPGDTWYGWYVDAREGESSYGNLGRWAVDDADEPYPWPSDGWPLAAWVCEIADALEQGRPMTRPDGTPEVGDQPVLYQGGLTWVDGRDLRIDAVPLDGPI